jgi:ferredoxin-NADP reductase
MPIFKLKLLRKETIARETMAFYFERPARLKFRAGQHGGFTLIDPPDIDPKGNFRPLSIASAPYEEQLMVAIRMRGSYFKEYLRTLPEGSLVEFDGPEGEFVLPKKDKPMVMIAGGIGITPFHSMLKQAAFDKSDREFILFYSNREREDAAFLDEFVKLEKELSHFKLVMNYTNTKAPLEENAETGRISKEMLSKYLETFDGTLFYLSGPTRMVWEMYKILKDAGVKHDDIRIDEFTGY